jgi:hypothetical protein
MQVKRWTLVVVCAAAAMLTLDLAVVNTALSSIGADLHTGLAGLQSGSLTPTPSRSPRPCCQPARWPIASAAGGCS